MAAYGWRKAASVTEGLFKEGHRFSFFQAVRLLERIFPRRTPVAEDVDPAREVVRFRTALGHDFPASEVAEVRPGRDSAEMTVTFLGLGGVNGPLPRAFTDLVRRQARQGDTGLRDFLDLFHHRLVSIFYRGRKKYRPPLGHEPPHEGRVARTLYAMLGLGTPGLRGDLLGAPERSLLPFTGMLVGQRSMVGLERLLSDYFGFPVEVLPFQGAWQQLDDHQWTRIGRSGQNQVLGSSALVGLRVWNQEAGLRLRIGPLTLRQLLEVLPVAPGFARLRALVRFYVGDDLDFDFLFVLRRGEIPEPRLGRAADARLGWSSRLGSARPAGGEGQLRLGRAGDARLGWTSWLGRPASDGQIQICTASRPTG